MRVGLFVTKSGRKEKGRRDAAREPAEGAFIQIGDYRRSINGS